MADDREAMAEPSSEALPAADVVIERFGGIRPAAAKLGMPVTTVQGWKTRGRIPENRHAAVRAVAAELGIDLSIGPSPPPAPSASVPASQLPNGGWRQTTTSETAEAPRAEPDGDGAAVDEPIPATEESETGPVSEDRPVERPARQNPVALTWIAIAISVTALVAFALLVFRPDVVEKLTDSELAVSAQDSGPALAPLQAEIADLRQQIDRLTAAQVELAAALESRGSAEGIESGALNQRLGEVSARLDTLDAGLSTLRSRADGFEERLGKISEATETGLPDSLSDLSDEVDELRQTVASLGERQAGGLDSELFSVRTALLLSVGQLEAAVRSGSPYRSALERARKVAASNPDLLQAMAQLEAYADRGVPSVRSLEDGLDNLESKLAAGPVPPDGRNVLESVWARVKSTVKLRRVDDSSASPVTRAENALAKGDMEAVLRATEGFGDAVEEWRRSVRGRLAAEVVLAEISGLLTAAETGESTPADGDSSVSAGPK